LISLVQNPDIYIQLFSCISTHW